MAPLKVALIQYKAAQSSHALLHFDGKGAVKHHFCYGEKSQVVIFKKKALTATVNETRGHLINKTFSFIQ